MQGKYRTVNSKSSLDFAIQELKECFDNNRWFQIQITTEKQRSQLQNNSLHLWLTQVAEALNEQGLDVREVLSQSKRREIPWTMAAVKEHLWKPTQQSFMGKKSTTQASTKEYTEIFEVLTKALSQFGVYVPWPHKDRK